MKNKGDMGCAFQPEKAGISLAAYLKNAGGILQEHGVENAAQEARWLAQHLLELQTADLVGASTRYLTPAEIEVLEKAFDRRAKREPLGRILGQASFWGRNFTLNEATLEPRLDTETLIEVALKNYPQGAKRILDIGTGSGCLLLTLLSEWPVATGVGIDIAPRAVEQARSNAAHLELGARAQFAVCGWADVTGAEYDLVMCNPPYIRQDEIAELMPEVREYDPFLALNGGQDGLKAYREIIERLPSLLISNGGVIFEVGFDQAQMVREMLMRHHFEDIKIYHDLAGQERVVAAKLSECA